MGYIRGAPAPLSFIPPLLLKALSGEGDKGSEVTKITTPIPL